jgi:hypothetical protein
LGPVTEEEIALRYISLQTEDGRMQTHMGKDPEGNTYEDAMYFNKAKEK